MNGFVLLNDARIVSLKWAVHFLVANFNEFNTEMSCRIKKQAINMWQKIAAGSDVRMNETQKYLHAMYNISVKQTNKQ